MRQPGGDSETDEHWIAFFLALFRDAVELWVSPTTQHGGSAKAVGIVNWLLHLV